MWLNLSPLDGSIQENSFRKIVSTGKLDCQSKRWIFLFKSWVIFRIIQISWPCQLNIQGRWEPVRTTGYFIAPDPSEQSNFSLNITSAGPGPPTTLTPLSTVLCLLLIWIFFMTLFPFTPIICSCYNVIFDLPQTGKVSSRNMATAKETIWTNHTTMALLCIILVLALVLKSMESHWPPLFLKTSRGEK